MVIGIRYIELAATATEATRLIKQRLIESAVPITDHPCTGEALNMATGRIELLNFMVVRVRDKHMITRGHNPQRMLEFHRRTMAIAVPKIKQTATGNRCRSTIRIEAEPPQGIDLCIGHIEPLAIARQATRLPKCGVHMDIVNPCLTSAAGKRLHIPREQISMPNLMRASHGNIEVLLLPIERPGRVQRHGSAIPRHIEHTSLFATAEHGFHRLAGEIHTPHHVISGIGNVKHIAL